VRTLCRRVRLVAIWRRPKLTAPGDPAHDHVVAGIVARSLELLCGARYSPRDNPVERVWGALKHCVADTAVTWSGRLRRIRSFFRFSTRTRSEVVPAMALAICSVAVLSDAAQAYNPRSRDRH
jgi:hypothetical protein